MPAASKARALSVNSDPPVKFSWQLYGGAVTVQPGALLSVNTTRTTPTLSDALTLTVRVPDVTCPPLGGCKFESTGGVVSDAPTGVFVGVRVGLFVGVGVGVRVGAFVRVGVGVRVGFLVAVGVAVGRGVRVRVGVAVGLFVGVGVGVRVGAFVDVGTVTCTTNDESTLSWTAILILPSGETYVLGAGSHCALNNP